MDPDVRGREGRGAVGNVSPASHRNFRLLIYWRENHGSAHQNSAHARPPIDHPGLISLGLPLCKGDVDFYFKHGRTQNASLNGSNNVIVIVILL